MHDLWSPIAGQQKIIEVLEPLSASEKIPHAFLFKGPEGVGKFFTALQFLKRVNCNKDLVIQNKVHKKISNLDEPYVKMVLPLPRGRGETPGDNPLDKLNKTSLEEISSQIQKKTINPYYKIRITDANNIKISSIREIKKEISFNYNEARYRGIFINDAHLMNLESQNALLKSLEEPPPGVIFILLTDNDDKLLPTIKSRCWVFDFVPLKEDEIISILTRWFQVDIKNAAKVAPFSDGSVIDAMELIDNDFNSLIDNVILILRYSLARRYFTSLSEINKFIDQKSPLKLKLLIKLMIKWFDDVVRNRVGITSYTFREHSETLSKFNNRYPDADINRVVARLNNISDSIDKNVNLNILTLNIIFELASTGLR